MKVFVALLVIGGLALISFKVIKREQPQPSMVAAVPMPTTPTYADLARKGVITPAQANNGSNVTAGSSFTSVGINGSAILRIKELTKNITVGKARF